MCVIPVGLNRDLDISTIWCVERYVSKKQIHSEVSELPQFATLWIIRLYIGKPELEKYKIAYFVDEHTFEKYWKWLKELLKKHKNYVEPDFPCFQRLSIEVADLFFGHNKKSTHARNAQREAALHKQYAEVKETLKHISPEIAAVQEEKARQKDIESKRAQDNNKFFQDYLGKKKKARMRNRYKVQLDELGPSMEKSIRASAEYYKKKSGKGLPPPEELNLGDEEDL